MTTWTRFLQKYWESGNNWVKFIYNKLNLNRDEHELFRGWNGSERESCDTWHHGSHLSNLV